MTLVYAKIIGMFVCGADPGGRGRGEGGVKGGLKLFKNEIYTYTAV